MISDRLDFSALAPYWHRSRDWWSARSLREQVLLGAFATFAIFVLLLILVVSPLRDARSDALARIRSADILEARLRSGPDDLVRSMSFRTGSVSAIVTNSTAAANLKISTVETVGGDSRVVFDNVPFDTLMNWTAEIEHNTPLRLREVTITGQGAPGFVSATVTVGE
ncbi:MAG: type II secretion system protein M [Alteraurantiacibacter sp.]